MGPTGIPYATRTWSPTTGCSRGCPRCWARGVSQRAPAYFGGDFSPREWPKRLGEPRSEAIRQVILVSFMGDLFDPAISDEFRDDVFDAMLDTPHLWLLLTKQMGNAHRYFDSTGNRAEYLAKIPDLWLGASVWDQDSYESAWQALLQIPACRYLSYEPALGPLRLNPWTIGLYEKSHPQLSWLVAGCESGSGRRPAPWTWLEAVQRQCRDAGVPVFVKQRGEHEDGSGEVVHIPPTGADVPSEIWRVMRARR